MSATVLVIEDYADLRAAVVSVLSRAHYVCDSVETSEAVERLRTHRYATILLAPKLPVSDDPVVRYLADHGEAGRVILMTDPDSDPVQDYRTLSKPFNREELLTQIR